jgi:hypothetical protein
MEPENWMQLHCFSLDAKNFVLYVLNLTQCFIRILYLCIIMQFYFIVAKFIFIYLFPLEIYTI